MLRYPFIIIMSLAFLFQRADFSFAYQNEIRSLSSVVAGSMDKVGSRKRVAVVDFTDEKGKVTDLGKFIADELSAALRNSAQGFEALDRAQLKSIAGQNDLTVGTPYDQNSVKQLGEAARVGAIVTGTITAFRTSVRVTINVVSTYIPKVVGSSSVDIARKGRIAELLSGAAPAGINLSGAWQCDDGGVYYIRQLGNKIWWFGENHPNSPSWSNVAYGEIYGSEIRLQWSDVPKGYIMNSGELILDIVSGGRLSARHKTGGFGGSVWTR
jgi:TolB-like protein